MAIDQNYAVQPGESTSAYNTRVADYNTSKNAGSPSDVNPNAQAPGAQAAIGTPDFMSQLQSKLLGQSDLISSEDTKLEGKLSEIVGGIQSGEKAGEGALNIDYNRQEQQAQQAGAQTLTSAEESQRGFATNTAALQRIQDQTTKNVNDLEDRKQELILQGQSAAAGQISQLQVQTLQFRQQAMQQTFQNILGLANLGQQAYQFSQTQAENARAQTFNEQNSISNIALKYGLQVGSNETLASITSKAMPFASAEEKAQLAKLQSDTNLNNAQAAKTLSDAKSNGALSPIDAAGYAATYYNLMASGRAAEAQAFLANVLDKGGSGAFKSVEDALQNQTDQEFSSDNLNSSITKLYAQGNNYNDILSTITNNPFASAQQKSDAAALAAKLEPKGQSVKSALSLPGVINENQRSFSSATPATTPPTADAVAAFNKAMKSSGL